MDATAAQAEATRLFALLRARKRAERAERARARLAAAELNEFVAECEANGIRVILETHPNPAQPRRHSGHSNSRRP